MARAERLLALLDLLRGREETTVNALAHELGVSRRTLLRDLAALRARGEPIDGEAGPGGGIRLDRHRGVLAVQLSLSEVVGLWLASRLSQASSDLPWSGSATSGLAKLLASLPGERARSLRALSRRVILGPPAGPATRADAGVAPPELLRLFEAAFSKGLGLGFQYRDGQGRVTARRIEPHGLLVVTPLWYVLARDVETRQPRMFRMDRISRPRLLTEVSFEPDPEVLRAHLRDQRWWQPLAGR